MPVKRKTKKRPVRRRRRRKGGKLSEKTKKRLRIGANVIMGLGGLFAADRIMKYQGAKPRIVHYEPRINYLGDPSDAIVRKEFLKEYGPVYGDL
tara:strand:+ start:771 stop:1052 length:282 start_codon:yes stop_codon:yes gene_type:complete